MAVEQLAEDAWFSNGKKEKMTGTNKKPWGLNPWNLCDSLPNVCSSVMRKLQYAGYQLESRNRTIVNLESYEVTAMIWALTEYMKRRGMKT